MPSKKLAVARSPGPRGKRASGSQTGSQTRHFRARLEPDHTELKWTILRVPEQLPGSWTEMRRLRVRGEVNSAPFRTSLFPDRVRAGCYVLLINKQVQQAAGVHVGDMVDVALEPDLEKRPSALPTELLRAFEGDRALRRWSEALSESTRRDIGKWIGGVKGPEAQAKRAAQMAERLLQAMEGEQVTPPVLAAILARSAKASAAWESLTPVQRRGHLLGIFYYQTPEARVRRAQKAADEALRVAERKAGDRHEFEG